MYLLEENHIEVFRKPIEEGDTCPICIESLTEDDDGLPPPLVYCRWGCGRAVHAACWQSWSGHRHAFGLTECLFCKAWM